jgi:hypothetical protein
MIRLEDNFIYSNMVLYDLLYLEVFEDMRNAMHAEVATIKSVCPLNIIYELRIGHKIDKLTGDGWQGVVIARRSGGKAQPQWMRKFVNDFNNLIPINILREKYESFLERPNRKD